MTSMIHTGIDAFRGTRAPKSKRLSKRALARYSREAEARYRGMTGMDLSRTERTERAKRHATKIAPLSTKPW